MADSKSVLDLETIQNPYPFYEELRRERPITYMPELKGYFVSSHALAKKVLIDKRFGKTPTVKDGSKFVPSNPISSSRRRISRAIGLLGTNLLPSFTVGVFPKRLSIRTFFASAWLETK